MSIQLVESRLIENVQNEEGKLYITGIFAQAEIVNGNGRFYSKSIMESAFNEYKARCIDTSTALGELNHPTGRNEVDLAEACIRVVEAHFDGNNIVGKALVLDTPKGKIVKALLEGGCKLGVSSRGTGKVNRNSKGIDEISDLRFNALIDVVQNPSAPDAMVDSIVEAKNSSINTNDIIKKAIKRINAL